MTGKVAGKGVVSRRNKSWQCNNRERIGIASAAKLFTLAKYWKKYTEPTATP